MADSQANDNNTCVVCFKNVLYYSIGECDHPVCYECSTRMRVLCLQNECPICRQDLARVVFTESILPYKELRAKVFPDKLFDRQFKIGFCTEEIKEAYEHLLENRCCFCPKLPPFRTFNMLNDHMRKVHEKFYCDLCVKHLKIFTFERKCYTRQELAHHRRKGDLDDTSHRGHPLCEFCEERFMDADELYRHLRKEHLYCHLCDADGRNLYYAGHAALAQHFRADHFLCEEGDCAGQHLTAVFRSEIDLKAHKATVHGRGLARGAARQARTLELSFNVPPPRAARHVERERERERAPSPARARIDTRSDLQFPRLSAAPPAPPPLLPTPNLNYSGSSGLARTDRNFPTLGGAAAPRRPAAPAAPGAHAAPPAGAAAVLRTSKPSVSIQLHSQPTSASNFRLTHTSGNRISIPPQHKRPPPDDDDFPMLGVRDDYPSVGAGTVQPPKVGMINSQEMQSIKKNIQNNQQKKPQQLSSEAFPALGPSAAPASPPQWLPATKGKKKASPPPEAAPPPQPSFNPVADFPTLPKTKKKQASTLKISTPSPRPTPRPAPPPVSTPAPTQINEKTKKEKKKNNAKKENLSEPSITINGLGNKLKGVELLETTQAVVDPKIKTIDTTPSDSVEKPKNRGNGDFKLAKQDYPPLSSKSDNSISNNVEVPSYKSRMTNGSVPPGFNAKPRPACNGLTFTNSSGQTFSAPLHSYIPPPNFEGRNMALVKKFNSALNNATALENFKVASRAFRDGITTADDFYEHCLTALGNHFDDVFPELVALLPDIAKQQELAAGRELPALEVCRTCGQLLASCDRISHDTAHWPALC